MRKLVPIVALTAAITGIGLAQSNTYPFPSSGNVGIGTTSPGSRKLAVQSSDPANDIGVEVIISRTSGANYGVAANAVGVGAALNQGVFASAHGGSSNFGVRIYNVPAAPSNYSLYSDAPAQSYFQGNVGIGTTSPGSKLEIYDGSLRLNGAATLSGYGGAELANVAGFGLQMASLNYDLRDANGTTSRIFISSSGNVGVGTAAPSEKLHLASGNLGLSWGYGLTIPGFSRTDLIRNGYDNVNGWEDYVKYTVPGNSGVGTVEMRMASGGGGKLTFMGGNVGIGTTNPTQKLSVKGTVRAQEVIVDTGWSDFVFDESYKLTALSETEAFVKAEKHLPGIPSAKEVAENGISVGEMQAKLLAKIEELTLHVIAQEKRIDEQVAEIAAMKAELRNGREELPAK